MLKELWEGYDQFKTQDDLIRDYYQAIGYCNSIALNELNPGRWNRTLDIACGHGDSTMLLAQQSDWVVGVDSSEALIEIAQGRKDFGANVDYLCSTFDEFQNPGEPFDLISATWFLNHVHSKADMETTIEKIKSLLVPGGHVSFVVPSDAFTSRRIQTLAREKFGWQQNWGEEQLEFTRGVFSYDGPWIPTTIWQPLYLMRRLNPWFKVQTLDVKSALLDAGLLPQFDAEPPFEVIYGTLRPSENQVFSNHQSTHRPGSIPLASAQSGTSTAPRSTDSRQRSYSSASHNTLEPSGYRHVADDPAELMSQLNRTFPGLAEFLNPQSMIVSAYPAALGLAGAAPLVDTYLHPATFIRSMRCAAEEGRNVVVTAQPLVGADFLLRCCDHPFELPQKILWAVGGYYLPKSLEDFIRDTLAARGCQLQLLYTYGVAELGHSCFAAVQRFDSLAPKFRLVATDVTASIVPQTGQLQLEKNGPVVGTGDYATQVGDDWQIVSGSQRLDPAVLKELESWSGYDWSRRTGFLSANQSASMVFQLREQIATAPSTNELRYHEFWQTQGGSLTCKPRWAIS